MLFLAQPTGATANLWVVRLGSDSAQCSGAVLVGPGRHWPSLVAAASLDWDTKVGWVLPCFESAEDQTRRRTPIQVGTSGRVYSPKSQADCTAQKCRLAGELKVLS